MAAAGALAVVAVILGQALAQAVLVRQARATAAAYTVVDMQPAQVTNRIGCAKATAAVVVRGLPVPIVLAMK